MRRNLLPGILFLLPTLAFLLSVEAQESGKIKAPDTVQGGLSGAVKSIQVFTQEEKGEKILKSEQTFNQAGDWLEIKQYQGGKMEVVTRYHYDSASGAMSSYERLDGDGKQILSATCSFVPELRQMICLFKSSEGKPTGREEVSYNEKGLETGSRQTDADGKFVNSSVVSRDEKGKPLHLNFSVPDHENYMQIDYQWDAKGFESNKVENAGSVKTSREFSVSDVDAAGNWTGRTVKVSGGDPASTTGPDVQAIKETRVIEYFKSQDN